MYKVRIFRDVSYYELEDAINDFLANHKYGVIDIKYQMSIDSSVDVHSAMVIYYDVKNVRG